MKFPKNALNYWDEGNKNLYKWYKKGFWKKYYKKKFLKNSAV